MKITPAQNYANEVPFGEGKYEIHGNKKNCNGKRAINKKFIHKRRAWKKAQGDHNGIVT